MSRKINVIVIGSGMAGLMAALAASQAGCSTAVFCEGMGNLSISGGAIDLLGYDQFGNFLPDPWSGMQNLPADHPYAILGPDNIKNALVKFAEISKKQGLEFKFSKDENGNERNTLLPTIFGTLKPVGMFYDNVDQNKLNEAKKILVIGIKGFRDCRPQLIVQQLKRYQDWKDKSFATLVLPPPFAEKGRSLNALDVAQAVEREAGRKWLFNAVRNKGQDYDLVFLPPVLGVRADSQARSGITEVLGCPCVELQCIPPGVGGMRIRHALVKCLEASNVEFFENVQVIGSRIKDDICEEITIHSSGRNVVHKADAYVIATGGIIGGGIILGEGSAKESVTGYPLEVPENVDAWTDPEIFGQHFISRLGVKVDASLQLQDSKNKIKNMFFAGRTIGGYDYASEKSGHGVAIATGWKAGENAAAYAGCKDAANAAQGEDK